MKKAYGRDMRVGSRKINRDRLGAIERELLVEITSADLGATVFRARSIGQALYMAEQNARKRARRQYEIKRKLDQLRRKGFLEVLESAEGDTVRITPTGSRELHFALKKWVRPHAWDKKWRILFFDIPETNTQLRQELRSLLKQIGYLHIQRSVYIYPYAVVELEELLTEKALPPSQLAYVVVERINNEDLFKKHFKLA